jgi:hypothetical protein
VTSSFILWAGTHPEEAYPGIMHFLIFWGVTIQCFGNDHQYPEYAAVFPWTTFPRGTAYLVYEVFMDLAGISHPGRSMHELSSGAWC